MARAMCDDVRCKCCMPDLLHVGPLEAVFSRFWVGQDDDPMDDYFTWMANHRNIDRCLETEVQKGERVRTWNRIEQKVFDYLEEILGCGGLADLKQRITGKA